MNNNFEALSDAYSNDSIDDVGQVALEAMIRADPQLAVELVKRMDQHHALADLMALPLTNSFIPTVDLERKKAVNQSAPSRSFRRKIRKRLPTSSAGLWLSLAASLFVIIGLFSVVFMDRQSESVTALAWVQSGDLPEQSLQAAYNFDATREIVVRYPDGSRILFAVGSHGRLSFDAGKQVRLHVGQMTATIAPQAAESPLMIITPHADYRIVGTAFTLTANASDSQLAVQHGIVAVQEIGQSEHLVYAGGGYLNGRPQFMKKAQAIAPPPIMLINDQTTWRYYDGQIYPGSDWFSTMFDDRFWPTGKSPFGYNVNKSKVHFNTVLSEKGLRSEKGLAVWFRCDFFVEHQLSQVSAQLTYDDGAVIYLNGQEVARYFMPDGPIHPTTPALHDKHISTQKSQVFLLPAAQFVKGRNVLAVAIHQRSRESSDMYFQLTVQATIAIEVTP